MNALPTKPEVLAIEEAHRAAQARLGIAGAYLALREWNGVGVSASITVGDAWLSRSIQMIRALSRKSRRLAKAYYQLARALETGHTLGLPEYSDNPRQVTMGGLRKQYLDLLLEVADLDKPESSVSAGEDPDERWLEDELTAPEPVTLSTSTVPVDFTNTDIDSYIQDLLDVTDDDDNDELVPVDPYEWEEPELTLEDIRREFAEELQAEADRRADAIRRIREDEELSAKEAFTKADKLHDAAGVVNAGKIDQAGIQPGRDLINTAASRDQRVMMWARGTGPNPCAFCAMLASRGFAYKSRARAMTTKGGGNQTSAFGGAEVKSYHPNCHCYPVLRWADIPDPTAPGRNAEWEQLWKDEIAGKRLDALGTTNDTLNHWRRIISARRREARRRELAALRTTTA